LHKKTPFYLIYVDVKGFKHINNLHGYKAGDEILGAVAARLTKAVGELGFVARIASNEFALILNIKNKAVANDNALIFAEALQSTLRQPYDTSLVQGLTLDVCIGLVRYPEHAMSADELMRNCDLALYYAKYRLDNAICAFSDELKRHSEERYKLEESLRRAIENGELEVYLQPIIDLKANRVVKCEALARWQHADGEFISPEVFIPVAEQTGLIIPFGNWLIDEVCKILQRFKQQAVDVRVAINVSARQVSDQDTIDYIISSIESYQVNPKQLSVELTESVLVHSYESVSALLVKLRQLGVIVSIDDFGTGFSSLSYLKHLSIDELKVDKSFIQDVGINNNEDSAIVLAILGLAKSLNLQVIAEGVETADQHQFLIDNNCDCAQGFLYSKPMTVAAFSSWYKDYASQP
jgi:diguanylate cyclase (GGDEF)-like protein